MPKPTFSHRAVIDFTDSDGSVVKAGDLCSNQNWSWQGQQYVEQKGWVKPLSGKEIATMTAEYEAQEAKVLAEKVAKEAAKTAKTTPAKKASKKAVADEAPADETVAPADETPVVPAPADDAPVVESTDAEPETK